MFKSASVLMVAVLAIVLLSGCAGGMGGPFSTGHYAGEGMLFGAGTGGALGYGLGKGRPEAIALGAVSGALLGALVGGQVPKQAGIYERDMGLDAKRQALLENCRRDEWNRVEQSIRYAQAYGGKPEQFYTPDYTRCDRLYGGGVPNSQPGLVQHQAPPYYRQPQPYPISGQPVYTPGHTGTYAPPFFNNTQPRRY